MAVSIQHVMRGGAKREYRRMNEQMRQRNDVQLQRMHQTWRKFLRYLEEDMQVVIDKHRGPP